MRDLSCFHGFVSTLVISEWNEGKGKGDVCMNKSSGTPGSGCSKPDQANPGLARILISVLQPFGELFSLYCLPFSFEL